MPQEFLDAMKTWIKDFKTQEIAGFVPDAHEKKVIKWIVDILPALKDGVLRSGLIKLDI